MTALFRVYEVDPKTRAITQHEPFWANDASIEGPAPDALSSLALGWHRGSAHELFKTIDDSAAYVIFIPTRE